jgi:hypothetical protein
MKMEAHARLEKKKIKEARRQEKALDSAVDDCRYPGGTASEKFNHSELTPRCAESPQQHE